RLMTDSVLSALLFFFFSSRRRHTRFDCDWSSDVCSSDLLLGGRGSSRVARSWHVTNLARPRAIRSALNLPATHRNISLCPSPFRSEERRVGKECRSRSAPHSCIEKRQHTHVKISKLSSQS